MVGLEEKNLVRELPNFTKDIKNSEFEKILAMKGFKKFEIGAILENLEINKG
jgi:poly(3-hydroxyalkanoate) synthetase